MASNINSLRSSARPPEPAYTLFPHASQPNILFIMADQLAAPQLSIYNPDSQIKTPNLDRLAASSVQFDSAYCSAPLCGPSHMSMITGLLPMKIGAYDSGSQISSEIPTYAHYLLARGYHTALAGNMQFHGVQTHGYKERTTTDIYPADFDWAVNWDGPDIRQERYHNVSSILKAGPCERSIQLDFDEEVVASSTGYLWDHVRQGPSKRPFALTVSLTHPHEPYTITKKYCDLYEDVNIALPKVRTAKEKLDSHSQRLMHVSDLWDQDFSDDQIKQAKRAYYGAVSYVDDCIGQLLKNLSDAGLAENTIIFSGDHGDMLGERPVPAPFLPMDGISMLPLLEGKPGHDIVFAEYTGEGTIRPIMMIRRGPWKYITCPADEPQLFNLQTDPYELDNLTRLLKSTPKNKTEEEAKSALINFDSEAKARWDFDAITAQVLQSQRSRRLVWDALQMNNKLD